MSTDYTKHKDKRVNNPTMEKRDFFVKEELTPYPARYDRDPSLDPPETGKIAVKVINHYGDEVLKVYEV